MTTAMDARVLQASTDTDRTHDAAADRDEPGKARAELVRLLAEAYVAAPLFA